MSHWDESDAFEAAVPLSQRAMAARPAPYLDGLNPAQRAAVEALDGPVLMLAGAGTGKTKALTSRIVHLLTMNRARTNEILAVTFTNKAAREMRNRVGLMLGDAAEGMQWLGTFHSLSVKILRRHAELVGLKSSFTILDTDDQKRLIKQTATAMGVEIRSSTDRWIAGIIEQYKNNAWVPERVPKGMEIWLDLDNGVEVSLDDQGKRQKGIVSSVDFYRVYQARLRALNATDFGDLLLHCVTIFQQYPDVLAQYQRWFRYILVDEYQDTNVCQYLWLRLLAQAHKNICCVGDDDQSIYGWRGAEVGNILRFEKDFPGATVIRLEQNYRSTPHILAAANTLIARNEERLGKSLRTAATKGRRVRLIGHWDGDEEARWVGEKIEDHQAGRSQEAKDRYNPRLTSFQQELDRRAKAGLGPIGEQAFVREAFETGKAYSDLKTCNLLIEMLKDSPNSGNMIAPLQAYGVKKFSLEEIAILVRASHQMRAFEDRFLTIGLPYRVIGGPKFYERLEIRDAMAYFRLAVSPADDLAFERVVNTPKRGLGDKAVQSIQLEARRIEMSLLEGARSLLAKGGIGGKGAAQLRAFVEGVDRWHAAVMNARPSLPEDSLIEPLLPDTPPAHDDGHIRLAEVILEESGYTSMWQNDKTPEAAGRLENLKELVKALENFDSLQGFLEHVALIMDNESETAEEKVTIMTLHAAKGLEFPVVFLPGWEEGIFPSQRSLDEDEEVTRRNRGMGPSKKRLEEERRLAYVGITRAEELCTISFASNRKVYGRWQMQHPSCFIDELPPANVKIEEARSPIAGGYGAAAGFGATAFDERVAKADVYNSPGWKRMQERSAQRPTSQPREARNMVIDAQAISAYGTGERVFHQKFGYGAVVGIEGDKLEIDFDHAGIKRVVASWVIPAHQVSDVPF